MPRWAQVLLGVTALVVVVRMFMPNIDRGNPHARRMQCLSNMKNLALAINMYVEDYDCPPDPRAWSDRLMEYVRNPDAYRCPQAGESRGSYAFNTGASTAHRGSPKSPEAARLVTIFESDWGRNAYGGPELLVAMPRHLGGDNYGFLDGHAKWVKRGDTSTPLDWHMPPAAPSRKGAGK